MNFSVRKLPIILTLAISLSVFAGCTQKQPAAQDSNSTAGQTTSKPSQASGNIKMLTGVTGGKDDAEMKLFQEALGKATGLTVTMEKPASDYDNVVMQKLQGGEKYDLIYVGMGQYLNLAKQGAEDPGSATPKQ